MSDLIDREQAKDAIDKYLVGRNLVTDGTMMARLINEIVINRLPSAQPTFDARDTQYNLPIGTDLISRQQAIKAFNTDVDMLIVGGEENAKAVEHYINGVIEKIKQLPSALGTNLAEVGTDLISRQDAISAICNTCGKIDCDKMDKCEKLQLSPANISETPNSSDTISRQQAIDVENNK